MARKYRDETKYSPVAKNHGNAKIWSELESILSDPYFAPLMAKDLSNLPRAYVITAQYDVLRDDGIMYARRLQQAGVDVTLRNYDGAIHTITHLYRALAYSKQCMDECVAYMISHF